MNQEDISKSLKKGDIYYHEILNYYGSKIKTF